MSGPGTNWCMANALEELERAERKKAVLRSWESKAAIGAETGLAGVKMASVGVRASKRLLTLK